MANFENAYAEDLGDHKIWSFEDSDYQDADDDIGWLQSFVTRTQYLASEARRIERDFEKVKNHCAAFDDTFADFAEQIEEMRMVTNDANQTLQRVLFHAESVVKLQAYADIERQIMEQN